MVSVPDGKRQQALQVVEAELQRIPRALLRGHSQELWSIVYMPQVSIWMVLGYSVLNIAVTLTKVASWTIAHDLTVRPTCRWASLCVWMATV